MKWATLVNPFQLVATYGRKVSI